MQRLGAGRSTEAAGQPPGLRSSLFQERHDLLELEDVAGQERGAHSQLVGPRHINRHGEHAGGDGRDDAWAQMRRCSHEREPSHRGRGRIVKRGDDDAASRKNSGDVRRHTQIVADDDAGDVVWWSRRGGIDPRRDERGVARLQAGVEGAVEIAMRRKRDSLRRRHQAVRRTLVDGVDDHGQIEAAADDGGDAAGVGAVRVQRESLMAVTEVAQRPRDGVDAHQVAEACFHPRADDGQEPITERGAQVAAAEDSIDDDAVVALQSARPGDDELGRFARDAEGQHIIDDDVDADAGVCSDEVNDRGHRQPRLMRAMGWMFISGLNSW